MGRRLLMMNWELTRLNTNRGIVLDQRGEYADDSYQDYFLRGVMDDARASRSRLLRSIKRSLLTWEHRMRLIGHYDKKG